MVSLPFCLIKTSFFKDAGYCGFPHQTLIEGKTMEELLLNHLTENETLFLHSPFHFEYKFKYNEEKQTIPIVYCNKTECHYVSGWCMHVSASILLWHPPGLIRSRAWTVNGGCSVPLHPGWLAGRCHGSERWQVLPMLPTTDGEKWPMWPGAPTCTHTHTESTGGLCCITLACECEWSWIFIDRIMSFYYNCFSDKVAFGLHRLKV